MATKKAIPFIVPGFFGYNTINVIAGLQESRKSWLLLDLAVSLSTGTPWLGKWPCARLKTIILDQERPAEEMQRRLDALVAGRGLTDDDVEGFLIPKAGLEPPFKLNLDPSFQAFERMIDEVRPEVVIMDSLKTIQTGDINSTTDMQRTFERLKGLRLKYKTAFVILHHENKGTYAAIRDKHIVTAENIEGSGVINQVPEGLFVARNFDGESTMLHHVKNSYGIKVPPFLVKVRDVTPDKSKISVEAF
jgi:RecA-family ATPase